MLQAAIADEPGFFTDDVEVKSSVAIRTVRTVRELRARFPTDELILLRGQDALERTHFRLFEIEGLRILVLAREGSPLVNEALKAKPWLAANRHRIDVVTGFEHTGSSTAVRKALQAGLPISGQVPAAVERLVYQNGWYQSG